MCVLRFHYTRGVSGLIFIIKLTEQKKTKGELTMTQNIQGLLSQEEITKAQNAISQGSQGQAAGMQSGGIQAGGMVKPGDKVEAKNAMQGVQSGGLVKPGDKIEAQNRM
jgi:hypothetical protein